MQSEMLDHKKPAAESDILMEMTLFDYHDKYGAPDSPQWLELFMLADRIAGNELADKLVQIRNRGSVLIRSDQYGYMIRPVIGPGTWNSQEEYDVFRAQLVKYQPQVIALLKQLRSVHP
jgi:hypothetical protein